MNRKTKLRIAFLIFTIALFASGMIYFQFEYRKIETDINKCDKLVVTFGSLEPKNGKQYILYESKNLKEFKDFAETISISKSKESCKCENVVIYNLFRQEKKSMSFSMPHNESIRFKDTGIDYELRSESKVKFKEWSKKSKINKKFTELLKNK